jgi:hypothetical protein
MDCFATLAMTDAFVVADATTTNHRHCEERSDEAIHVCEKSQNKYRA